MVITAHSNIHSIMKSFNRVILVQPSTVTPISFIATDDQKPFVNKDTKHEIKNEEEEEEVETGDGEMKEEFKGEFENEIEEGEIIVEEEAKEEKEEESLQQNMYQCDSCDEGFPDRSSLIIHQTEQSIVRTRAALREPVVNYTCKMCNRTFVTKNRYQQHQKNCGYVEADTKVIHKRRKPRNPPQPRKLNENGEEEPAPCTKCDRVFKKEKYLRVHMMTAHAEYITCQICDEKFDTLALMKSHMSEVHSDEFTEHCEICNKGFYLRQSLKVHMAAHQRDDNLCICDTCGKQFRHEVYLNKHVQLVHVNPTERRRFNCDKCDYQTDQRTCFREHMYKHTGEDIIGCEVCGKQLRRGYLKMHLRIHTGEKPEICEYCGKAFSARKYLTKHRITHTGEKPHECRKCGKTYTQRGTLIMHLRKHHPEEAKKWIAKGPGRTPRMTRECKHEMVIGEDGTIIEVVKKAADVDKKVRVEAVEEVGEEFISEEGEVLLQDVDIGGNENEEGEIQMSSLIETGERMDDDDT